MALAWSLMENTNNWDARHAGFRQIPWPSVINQERRSSVHLWLPTSLPAHVLVCRVGSLQHARGRGYKQERLGQSGVLLCRGDA